MQQKKQGRVQGGSKNPLKSRSNQEKGSHKWLEQNPEKVSRSEGLIFAAGDLYGGGAQVIISFFYLIFLTDVVGLRPGLAGTVVLISKIWDAISDPLMGVITDNTRSRWGRRRPYFLIGFFGIIASFLLLWYPVSFGNQVWQFLFVLVSYLFYSTIQTVVMVPYVAMSSEISNDYQERTAINGTRLFFSQFASLLCAVLPLEIVNLFASPTTGYPVMAFVFGLFFAVPFLLIFVFAKERVPVSTERSKLDIKALIQPFKVRSFRILILIYLLAFFAMDVVSTIFAYYMNYYLLRPGELNFVLGAMLIMQIVMVPLIVVLTKKLEKATIVQYSVVVWLLGLVVLGLVQPGWWVGAIYVAAVILGAGMVGCIVMAWTMYPDVTDVGELAFGKRSSGSFSGVMTFMRKFSSAVGIFVVSQILDFSGYIQPTDGVMAEQPEAVLLALKLIVTILPLGLLVVVFLAARRYPITTTVYGRLKEQLKFQRGESSEGVDSETLNTLKTTLIEGEKR